jgi:transcriptional regulator with XRE-family HTH domain
MSGRDFDNRRFNRGPGVFQPSRIPPRAHPLARRLIEELNAQERSQSWLARKAGVAHSTIDNWKYGTTPSLAHLEACFNALGFDFVVVQRSVTELEST